MSVLLWLAKIGVSALVLSLLIGSVGWVKIAGALGSVDTSWILLFYGLALVTPTIYALQLSRLFRALGVDIGLRRVFLANSLAALYSLVAPGDIVAGAAKWSDLSAASGQRLLVLNAMIYNRLAVLVMSLGVGSLAIFWENPFADSTLQIAISLLCLTLAGMAFAIFSPQTRPLVGSLLTSAGNHLPQGVERRIESLVNTLDLFHGMTARHHATILILASLGSLSGALSTYVVVLSLGVEVPFAVLLWTQPVLLVARLLPISISNLGIREGLLIFVFGLYGVAAERAFGVGILAFSGIALIAIVGLFYQIALLLGVASWRPGNDGG